MKNLTRLDLSQVAAKASGKPIPLCNEVLTLMLAHITASLARGESVQLRGHGITLSPVKRAGRYARNPRINAPVWVPEHVTVWGEFGRIKKDMK